MHRGETLTLSLPAPEVQAASSGALQAAAKRLEDHTHRSPTHVTRRSAGADAGPRNEQ